MTPRADELGAGPPADVATANARAKAEAVAGSQRDDVVLGVDTVVALGERIYGKPADSEQARRFLSELSGRTHTVLSGVALVGAGGERVGVATTSVSFRELDRATLDLYLRSGEWRERAGGYAIQGLGSVLVERIEGDFSNVVGLPVPLLLELAPELFEA